MSKITTVKAYGDAIGPLGFPMQSDLAKLAESALKALPAEMRDRFKSNIGGQVVDGYCRSFVTPKGLDFIDAENSDVSVITSEAIDHDGEMVLASGLDFSVFQKNMVVPFCHIYDQPPVGRAMWVSRTKTISGEGWKAKTRYTPRPSDHPESAEWFPSTVAHFVKCGDMQGKSIGFIPLNIRIPTASEKKARPALDGATVIDKAMVLEFSVCPLPANPESLVESVGKMKAKGITIPQGILDAMGIVIPESAQSVAQVEQPIIIETKAAENVNAEGGYTVTMPACPKCKTADHMTQADDDYQCKGCNVKYKMDDAGAMTECTKTIKRFVRPETIAKAIAAREQKLAEQIAKKMEAALIDRIDKMLGTV